MKQLIDYEAEELARKEEQQAAIRTEKKRDWKQLGMRFVLHMLIYAVTVFCMWEYRDWIEYDWFTPPTEVLTESEYRELVDGYPRLVEALGGTYRENMESMTRGQTKYVLDRDGDGAVDVEVLVRLFGKYKSMGMGHNLQTGEVTHHNTLREPEGLNHNGLRRRYGLKEFFNGRAWSIREETIYVSNHEAEITIKVQNPSKGFVEARAEIEKLLAIVRQGQAE